MNDPLIIFLIILLLVFLAINGIVLFSFFRKKSDEKNDEASASLVIQQLNDLSKKMDDKLGQSGKEMNQTVREQFQDSQKLIQEINQQVNKQLQDVTRGQVEMKERSNQIFTVVEQLQDLQRTLKSQKERGNFGEASLELILSNILPPDVYEMEYQFADGDRVDAIIRAQDGLIPIDAKFSLDSYTQLANETDPNERKKLEKNFKDDLKKRIDETSKYIKTKEGTLPFAFMFIPAEGIYYDLLINRVGGSKVNTRSLIDYAMNDKKIIIVSPTTFYAYLQSVLYGFNAFKIEKNAETISKNVSELKRHLKKYDDFFKKMGNSLKTTVNHYNSADKEFLKIDKDVVRITGESVGMDSLQIDRPQLERDED